MGSPSSYGSNTSNRKDYSGKSGQAKTVTMRRASGGAKKASKIKK